MKPNKSETEEKDYNGKQNNLATSLLSIKIILYEASMNGKLVWPETLVANDPIQFKNCAQ